MTTSAFSPPTERTTPVIIRQINPAGLANNPAFSQAVAVDGATTTIYVGGQNGVDEHGRVVADTVADQTRQALRNVATILDAEGATLANIVRWTISVVSGHSVVDGFSAFQEAWNPADPPPAISVLVVAGLVNPEFLVEIDAIAVV